MFSCSITFVNSVVCITFRNMEMLAIIVAVFSLRLYVVKLAQHFGKAVCREIGPALWKMICEIV